MTSWTAGAGLPGHQPRGLRTYVSSTNWGEWRIDHADTVLTTYTGKCLVAAANAYAGGYSTPGAKGHLGLMTMP